MYGHNSLASDWVYDELTEDEYNDLMELTPPAINDRQKDR